MTPRVDKFGQLLDMADIETRYPRRPQPCVRLYHAGTPFSIVVCEKFWDVEALKTNGWMDSR